MKLSLKKFPQEGSLENAYSPLHNIVNARGELCDFTTTELAMDLEHPLQVDCQPSYDGSVNLIINDDLNPPRIINSRFTKIEGDRYRIISRNQRKQTNLYEETKIDQQTRLFRTLNTTPKLQLHSIGHHGQMKGGEYHFYIKFGDEDNNKTDFVAESGAIHLFHGTEGFPTTVSGTISDERTNKSVKLILSGIDTSFSNVYLYCSRSTSDTNGIRASECLEFIKPYKITDDSMTIIITGFEDTVNILESELNIQYLTANAVKTHTQVQNRLFFGNIESNIPNNTELQNLSYYIRVQCTQDADKNDRLGYVDLDYKTTDVAGTNGEYYNAQNLYYRLGYWPEEIYRLGIVYILNDDTLTDVYNLRGCDFGKTEDATGECWNINEVVDEESIKTVIPKEDFLNLGRYENTYGVFKNPKWEVIQKNEVKPIFYKFEFNESLLKKLQENKVKGFFIVRQRRIPTIVAQGLEMGINKNCYVPMIWNGTTYIAESFKSSDNTLTTNLNSRILTASNKQSSALLCLDAVTNPQIQADFNGQNFTLSEVYNTQVTKSNRRFKYVYSSASDNKSFNSKLIYVPGNVSSKTIDDFCFSTKAGNASSVSDLAFWDTPNRATYLSKTPNLVRGLYTPFIGTNANLTPGAVYNIKVPGYSEAFQKEYFDIRGYDNSEFMAITDRYSIFDEITSTNNTINVYRGDCFINTVTMRINRNFIDPDVPIDDIIVDENTWSNNYKGYYGAVYTNGRQGSGDQQVDVLRDIADSLIGNNSQDRDKITKFYKINRADTNAVPLGMWVTFKCLSNYNLSMRSLDRRDIKEMSTMGNAKTFYPISGISTRSSYKISESELLNNGYSNTLSLRRNFKYADVPYIKDQFDNRIMFSNIQVNDDFKNSYRIFQGLSYQDIDRQYGSIVKLLPWYSYGSMNMLAVFEHGIGIVPVNEKALLQSTTGQEIHMYGSGVLQRDVTVVSPDFGSTWIDSIIKTPLAIYGVDTYAKKIWKLPLGGGQLESISDMHIQQFLNDHMTFTEESKTPIIALRNVKTHYNNYKGDVMFTFYDYEHNEEWNFCYNERIKQWVTRYTWIPLFSENINNQYFSFDKKRAEYLAYVYQSSETPQKSKLESRVGIALDKHEYISGDFETEVSLTGFINFDTADIKINSIDTVYQENDIIHTVSEKYLDDNHNTNRIKINSKYLDKSKNVLYYLINVTVDPIKTINTDDFELDVTSFSSFNTTVAIINRNCDSKLQENGVYLHGRAGVYDELDYFNESKDDQILPTKWYGKQEPFEFEFVVSQPTGLHKILDNLIIISNNVKPDSLDIEVIGDVYDFNKVGLYWANHCSHNEKINHEFDVNYNKPHKSFLDGEDIEFQVSQSFKTFDGKDQVEIVWDHVTDTYSLKVHQDLKDVKNPKYGILLGNIQYKEDSWKGVIEPIRYNSRIKFNGNVVEDSQKQSTKIRDKFFKIRVKYTGEDLAIITSLKSLITMSYA